MKIITLDKPIEAHGRSVTRIVMHEPTVLETLRLGDPYTVGQTPDGVKFMSENGEAIEGYLKICIKEPEDPMVILAARRPDLVPTLKQALFGFFHPADEGDKGSDEASKTSSTSSPSPASGTSDRTLSIV